MARSCRAFRAFEPQAEETSIEPHFDALTPKREKRGDEATAGLTDYFLKLIDERRRRPQDDLLSALCVVEDEAAG